MGSLGEDRGAKLRVAVCKSRADPILELERARMRHDKTVSGTRDDRIRDEPPPLAVVAEFVPEEEEMVAEHAREIRAVAKGPMSEAEAVAFVVEKLGVACCPSPIACGSY